MCSQVGVGVRDLEVVRAVEIWMERLGCDDMVSDCRMIGRQ